MQSFESSNGFFPLDAYFYPPATDTGFASVASSSSLPYEDTSFPNSSQQQYYYPDNFLRSLGFPTVASSSIPKPVVDPNGIVNNVARNFPRCYYYPSNLPLQGLSTDHTTHPQVTPA